MSRSSSPIPLTPEVSSDNPVDSALTPIVDALQHLISNVFGFSKTTRIYQALKYCEVYTIAQFLAIDEESVQELTYLDTSGKESALPTVQQRQLLKACEFLHHCREQLKRPLAPREWLQYDFNDFTEFLATVKRPSSAPTRDATDETATSNPSKVIHFGEESSLPDKESAQVHQPSGLAHDFVKSIRRDVSQYVPFKEDKNWDRWQFDLIAKGRSHGISNVFNPDYVPQTPEEIELFRAQQAFAYSLFVTHVLTPTRRLIVRTLEMHRRYILTYLTDIPSRQKLVTTQTNYVLRFLR